MMVFLRNGPAKNLKGALSEQSGFKIGARTAVSARSWLPIKFARAKLSALPSGRLPESAQPSEKALRKDLNFEPSWVSNFSTVR